MKIREIVLIVSILLSAASYAENQTIPIDRKITEMVTYGELVLIKFTPEFVNSQGCSSTSKNIIQLDFSDDPSKALYSSLLAAAASKADVGFAIGGCAGQFPKLYRVNMKF